MLHQNLRSQVDSAIYLPALHPTYAQTIVKNPASLRPLPSGVTLSDLNFFNPNSRLFHLPCALYSAGHVNMERPKPLMLSNRNPAETIVLGDSGGYQIINGHLQLSSDHQRRQIFDWLTTHSNLSMTLDVPTLSLDRPASGYKQFDDCLNDTLAHLERFAEWNKDIQHPFLNVLQGNNLPQSDQWYAAVKHFPFGGWAFAGYLRKNLHLTIRRLLEMERDGLIGEDRQWVHFLGVGDIQTAAFLTIIRDGLRARLNDPNIQFSMDTSSPLLAAGKFYEVYTDAVLNRTGFRVSSKKISANDPNLVGSAAPFSYPLSPIGQRLTWGDLIVKGKTHARSRWDTLTSCMLMNHNIYVHMQALQQANELMQLPRNEAIRRMPQAFVDARDAIQEVFSSRFPDATLKLHRQKILDVCVKG